MLHELIDKDKPCCLYCNAEFDTNAMSIRSSSAWGPQTTTQHDAETLYCVDCKEFFEIYSHQYDDGETHFTGFTFTCKDLNVFVNYIESVMDISDLQGKRHTAIPSFNPDFSDRNKLREKLRTYLIFS
jgi:hypothetical protein